MPAGLCVSETLCKNSVIGISSFQCHCPVLNNCNLHKSLLSDYFKRASFPLSNFAFNWKLLQIEPL